MKKITLILGLFFVTSFYNLALNGQSMPSSKISMYGLVLPKNQVTLRSAIESHVLTIHVREGQQVNQGDLLVELDSRTALASRKVAKHAAEEIGARTFAEAELEYAKEFFRRVSRLHTQKAMNDRDLKDARLRLKRAEAGLQIEMERGTSNQARFELADAELQKYYLRAPFDGLINHLKVNLGDAVISNTDILELISLKQLRVELFLPLKRANEISIGKTYGLQVESPLEQKQIVNGKVVFRSPMIEATTGTIRVVFEIDNRRNNLPAGFTVSVLESDHASNDTINPKTQLTSTPNN